MIALNFFSIFLFSLLLIKATDILIINVKKIAASTRIGEFALTSLILALATSLPELFVGISAALSGIPNLSLGNVIGSNIIDLSLVIGGAALIGGGLAVEGIFVSQDVFYAFLAGAAPMLLLFDKKLSRLDGLILLALYGFYQASVLYPKGIKSAKKKEVRESNKKIIRHLNYGLKTPLISSVSWIFFGIALLLFSSDMLVRAATDLAFKFNLPLLLIGLFIVALSTSLPELFFEIQAARKHQPSLVFGDLLGSVVANGTLIVGLTSLISPFSVQFLADYLVSTMAYVAVFGLFYLFIRTKRKLEQWEGVVLILFFLIFALFEFLR